MNGLKINSDSKIVVSFSGGRTSAVMSKMLLDYYGKRRCRFVFANTSSEHPKTLEFVNKCDEAWDLGVVWVEAKINHKGKGRAFGTKYNVTDYKNAKRNNEVFEDMVKKYGLPNTSYLHCTRELKERPILAWVKDTQPENYHLAIGIRADEMDRVNMDGMRKRNIIYPLLDWGITKPDVLGFWRRQEFDLGLQEHHGNCVFCHKKSDRKLFTLAKENPEYFEFPKHVGRKYEFVNSPDGRKIYRKHRSAEDILREANSKDFKMWDDKYVLNGYDELDVGGACGESCEVFTDLI